MDCGRIVAFSCCHIAMLSLLSVIPHLGLVQYALEALLIVLVLPCLTSHSMMMPVFCICTSLRIITIHSDRVKAIARIVEGELSNHENIVHMQDYSIRGNDGTCQYGPSRVPIVHNLSGDQENQDNPQQHKETVRACNGTLAPG